MSNGTEIHNEICNKFRDKEYSKEFIEKYTDQGCSEINKVIIEDIISNNNILIGYCDVVVDYDDNYGRKQKALIEVKSSADIINKDPQEVLRQIKKYRFYNKNFTKTFLVFTSEGSNVYYVGDEDLFTEEVIKVVDINMFENELSNHTGDDWTEPFTGIVFVHMPRGSFMMGSDAPVAENDEQPVHEVHLDGFWLGKYPVTQRQWQKIMDNNPSHFKPGDDFPVEMVSWNDAKQFISRLNQLSSQQFVLPSEAQWEYAARSGGREEKYAGGNELGRLAWYDSNSGRKTHRVGTKAPNGLGIYDMSGNVWEWCEDVYEDNAYFKHASNNPVVSSGGSYRVNRGGSWLDNPGFVRATYRGRLSDGHRNFHLGFRLALPQVRQE